MGSFRDYDKDGRGTLVGIPSPKDPRTQLKGVQGPNKY